MSKRTTLTLDDDVASKLDAEVRRSGKTFKEAVNTALRRGLTPDRPRDNKPFRVRARALGLKPGLALDNVEGLLDRIDGPRRS